MKKLNQPILKGIWIRHVLSVKLYILVASYLEQRAVSKQGNQSINTSNDSECDFDVVTKHAKKCPHGNDKELFINDLKRPRLMQMCM